MQYLKGKEAPWFYVNCKVKTSELWEYNLEAKDSKHIVYRMHVNFIDDVIKAWCRFNFNIHQNSEDVTEQWIWGNSQIRRANKPIFKVEKMGG